jgi:hypothetical protein
MQRTKGVYENVLEVLPPEDEATIQPASLQLKRTQENLKEATKCTAIVEEEQRNLTQHQHWLSTIAFPHPLDVPKLDPFGNLEGCAAQFVEMCSHGSSPIVECGQIIKTTIASVTEKVRVS